MTEINYLTDRIDEISVSSNPHIKKKSMKIPVFLFLQKPTIVGMNLLNKTPAKTYLYYNANSPKKNKNKYQMIETTSKHGNHIFKLHKS